MAEFEQILGNSNTFDFFKKFDLFGIIQSSPALELSSPLRGISAFEHVLLEFDLKLKNTAGDGADADADDVLVDACIEFVDRTITCSAGRLLRSRIEGPICSLDMDYMFVKSSVEAAVEVFLGDSCASCFQSVAAVYRAIAGDGDGGGDGIVIHEESIPLPLKLMLAADTATAQAASAATVVAVPLAGELTVTLGEAERAELQRVVGFVVPAGARGGEPGAGQRCRRRLVHPVLGVPREAEEAVAVGGAREDEGRGVAPLAGRQLGVQLVGELVAIFVRVSFYRGSCCKTRNVHIRIGNFGLRFLKFQSFRTAPMRYYFDRNFQHFLIFREFW